MQTLQLDLGGVVRRSEPPAPAPAQPGTQPGAARDSAGPAVRAAAVTKRFGKNVILDGLDLEIRAGEFVALLGRSGCGKTTLLRTLAGLDGITSGTLQVPRALAAAFQEPRLMPWKRAWRNVTLGLNIPQARERARAALAEVGLAHRENAWPATLSGGEAQRVALARALVREPQLLLLDEPFAALDALTRIRMHRLILQLWARHRPAVLLVTHDVDEAILLADRVLVLEKGRFVADIAVREPRPRRGERHEFQQLRARLLQLLGVDADIDAGIDTDPAADLAADAGTSAAAGPELHYAHN
ncbi:ABC transporter ATP-binding protein [Pseudoduganella umbonata]|uniref:ABC transporter ATP-binding protein n=1 Tax=Pseudoduganella umbonata TaxID=864828 RepID=A0A4P8HNK9_9BURK|nr:ABC transporter ATP-binding protein [Pseudoduganella umbonata]MBB3220025.1 sulfonate transport system ATP-binding protein [Pseudoduganella umbonata]QCP10032.1 ABC transporter ATP-binding protein [Pseudoduganella umbonata]